MKHIGNRALAVVFGAFALNALAQVVMRLIGESADPLPLTALQCADGISATLAAVGAWRLPRWAPVAALGYGIVTAVLLGSLPMLLDLGADEGRVGIWVAGGVMFLFGLWAAQYLSRVRRRLVSRQPTT